MLALAAVGLGLDVLTHLWGLIVLAAACGGLWVGRRSKSTDGRDLRRAVAASLRLAAELDVTRRELAEARESAALAWDASADRPPRPDVPEPEPRGRLLADPRSGVRPLTRGDDAPAA